MTLALSNSFNDLVQYIGNGVSQGFEQVEDIWLGRGPYEVYWDYFYDMASKVTEVVKTILVVLVSLALMIANPGFFVVFFAVGFVFDVEVSGRLEAVWQRVKQQSWSLLLAAGCAAFVSLPVTVAILSSTWALYLGSSLSAQGLAAQDLAAQDLPAQDLPAHDRATQDQAAQEVSI